MNIPSVRARRDMEIVAELRAQGATWETAALVVGRQPGLVRRWTRVYRNEWELLLKEAQARRSQQVGDKARGVLRELMLSKKSNVRLKAAEKLAWLRKEDKAMEAPPDPYADAAALIAAVDGMSDDELEKYIAQFLIKTGGDFGVQGNIGAS